MFARCEARDGGIQTTTEALSPAERLEPLHPCAFAIMPLFALANADVKIDLAGLAAPVAIGAASGLIFGKPLGIVLFSWASVRLGITRLPEGLNWKVMIGAGCLGGIGFTMSLFIASLAFEGALLEESKIGILLGSAVSAVLGCLLLWIFPPGRIHPEPILSDIQETPCSRRCPEKFRERIITSALSLILRVVA